MQAFVVGHASHPDASLALALAAAHIDAQLAARQPAFVATLGIVYLSDRLADQAEALLSGVQRRWPGLQWVGNVGIGVIAGGTEYFDEPALVLMLCALPAGSFQLFSGRQPLVASNSTASDSAASDSAAGRDARPGSGSRGFRGFQPHTALVHADPATHDLDDLLVELAARTDSGYLFGGLGGSRTRRPHIADGVFEGGLSGVAFASPVAAPGLRLLSRVSQGCQPLGPTRRLTAADGNVALTLDDQPALDLLLTELQVSLQQPEQAIAALRQTLIGLTAGDGPALARGGQFGADTLVRHLIGIDPARQGIAVAETLQVGQHFAFCRRDVAAARRDLVRICAEIRDELETEPAPTATPIDGPVTGPRIVGAIYVSCSGRGGPHFGGPSAEAQILAHALGDVPLVGFFAGGEIGHHHLYGYTGVLTVVVAD